jgi:hypothetical protein
MYGVIEAEVFRPNYSRNDMKALAMAFVFLGEKPSIYTRPWVARITGLDAQWMFKRIFMRGTYDYSQTNRVGSRGTRLYFAVPPGIYEVCRNTGWQRYERFFCRVENNGDIMRITREEVIACLENS